jgi:hypothetical protein
LASAIQAYESGFGGFGRPGFDSAVVARMPIRASPPAARAARRQP